MVLGNMVKRLQKNIWGPKDYKETQQKYSLEVSFKKLAEDHGKLEKKEIGADILLYSRRVSSDTKFRAQWSICSTIHFNNIDLGVFHVVVFIS